MLTLHTENNLINLNLNIAIMKKMFLSLLVCLFSLHMLATDFNKVNVWSGSQALSWTSSDWITLAGSKFADAQAGDQLVFTVTATGSNPQLQINNKSWKSITENDCDNVSGSSLTLTLTADQVTACQNGLYIKGDGVTVTSIDLMQQSAVTQYASTAIWTGSEALGNWTGTITIDASKFATAKAGDKVKFVFADATSSAQIQVNEANPWTTIIEYDNIVDGVYELTLTDETVAQFKAGGLAVKGHDATLTEVDLLVAGTAGADGTVDTGLYEVDVDCGLPFTFADGWENTFFKVPASVFTDAQVGDYLRFSISDLGKTPQLQINDASTWKSVTAKSQVDVSGDNYTLEITDEEMLAKMKNGLYIKGNAVTVTAVTLLTHTKPATYDDGTVILEGDYNLGSWSQDVLVPAEKFANAKEGDKVVIYFSDVESGAQIQVAASDVDEAGTWREFVPYDDVAGSTYTYIIQGDCTAKGVATNDLAAFQKNGMGLKGQKAHIVKVVLYSLQTTGINAATTDKNTSLDPDAPCEIYTLSGMRVSEMKAGNIYILRQGGKAIKVRK